MERLITLMLMIWFGVLDCAQSRCVELDHVWHQNRSEIVPFRSGMELGFIYTNAKWSSYFKIGFYIQEDGKDVAHIYITEDSRNQLVEMQWNFRNRTRWQTLRTKKFEQGAIKLGIEKKVQFFYSDGFFNVTLWDVNGQELTLTLVGATTHGAGRLTLYARIPDGPEYVFVVFFPCPEPETEKSCKGSHHIAYILFPILIVLLFAIALGIMFFRKTRIMKRFPSRTVLENEDL